jgi:microcystin degradation protein MlrC
VLKDKTVAVVVTSRAVMRYDRSLGFLVHDQEPERFDAVIVKSPHCQPRSFAGWAARIVNIDGPGATSANLRSSGRARCPRPIFPPDPEVPFTPTVQRFSRPRYRVLPTTDEVAS